MSHSGMLPPSEGHSGHRVMRKHQPDRLIREVPRRQTQAHRPQLEDLLGGKPDQEGAILKAYRRYGYRMNQIAEHLGVHYSTVSRRLRHAEKDDV